MRGVDGRDRRADRSGTDAPEVPTGVPTYSVLWSDSIETSPGRHHPLRRRLRGGKGSRIRSTGAPA